MSFNLKLWGNASWKRCYQTRWLNVFWYPDNDQSKGYLVEYKDAPGQFYVTQESTNRNNIVAGPFDSMEAAMVAYMLVNGVACV